MRYPERLLKLQASVYGLYHMTDPGAFYNREDLWSVASEVGMNSQREQAAQTMEPNFVLMTLPGEKTTEFVEILGSLIVIPVGRALLYAVFTTT